jgi:hypothetical protein
MWDCAGVSAGHWITMTLMKKKLRCRWKGIVFDSGCPYFLLVDSTLPGGRGILNQEEAQ